MDFQHAKMTYMAELDNNIRYYRSGLLKVLPEEKESIKQLIHFLNTCKRLDMKEIETEKELLKQTIGNMLYETLETGHVTNEFLVVWKTSIHQASMYYTKCQILCEFMRGVLGEDEYKNEEKRATDDMVVCIQSETTLEVLIAP